MVHIKGSNECCEDTYGPLHETPVKQAKRWEDGKSDYVPHLPKKVMWVPQYFLPVWVEKVFEPYMTKNLMSQPNCTLIEANLRLFSGESPVMHSFIRLLNLLETL